MPGVEGYSVAWMEEQEGGTDQDGVEFRVHAASLETLFKKNSFCNYLLMKLNEDYLDKYP